MENHFNCIYCYTNKVNGKKYVGQAVDFIKRHKTHINQAYNENQKYDYNVPFHNAIRRHGIENFEIEILIENLQNQEELNYWECYYIVEFDTLAKNQKGYNLASGGSNGNPLAGKTDEELAERSRKISETMNNKSEEELAEIRRKQSEAHKGKNPYSGKSDEELAEIRRKWHETMNNKSEEEKAERSRKISEANKGEKNGMYGVHRYGEKNPRARKVVSVDPLTKQFVFIWQYKQQATNFYGINRTTLDAYLKGKRKTGHEYNGFLWYYLDEYEQLTK